ncbi:RNA helicase [Mitosporidium daphniae]
MLNITCSPIVTVSFVRVRFFTSTALKNPAAWFPLARSMKRKIIAHLGPTNSGKTHAALQRLRESGEQGEGGVYCAPLRLLAMEMYDRLNAEGLRCGLATGEAIRGPKLCTTFERKTDDENATLNSASIDDGEKTRDLEVMDSLRVLFGYDSSTLRKRIQDAPFLSCTVEMADYGTPIGVAVIDEIQMMSDPDRGWAFTHALLGLPAKEIHVCGEPAILPLLKRISLLLEETIEIHTHYKRLVPLEAESKPLGRIHAGGGLMTNVSHSCGSLSLRKGDCVIAFSRRSIFLTKKAIEMQTKRKVAVIYGTLPLESRTVQARLFNDPNSDYDVLVATDAIGMGLNLNIKRIIFSSLLKWDGGKKAMIPHQAIRQISGRAGRFGSVYDERGLVTA